MHTLRDKKAEPAERAEAAAAIAARRVSERASERASESEREREIARKRARESKQMEEKAHDSIELLRIKQRAAIQDLKLIRKKLQYIHQERCPRPLPTAGRKRDGRAGQAVRAQEWCASTKAERVDASVHPALECSVARAKQVLSRQEQAEKQRLALSQQAKATSEDEGMAGRSSVRPSSETHPVPNMQTQPRWQSQQTRVYSGASEQRRGEMKAMRVKGGGHRKLYLESKDKLQVSRETTRKLTELAGDVGSLLDQADAMLTRSAANLSASAVLGQYGVYARDAVGRVLVEDGLMRMPVLRPFVPFEGERDAQKTRGTSVTLRGRRMGLLTWLNDALEVRYMKVEQCANGAAYCQIFDMIHPGTVPCQKLRFDARNAYDSLENYKILQRLFQQRSIPKVLDVENLIAGSPSGNYQMLLWCKHYFDRHANLRVHADQPYEAAFRRRGEESGEMQRERKRQSEQQRREDAAFMNAFARPKTRPEIHEFQLTADWDKGYYLDTFPPMGSFTLRQGTRHVCTLSASASAQDVARLMPNDAYFGRVAVLKERGIVAGEQMDRWIVTFLDLHGKRDLASVDMHQLEGGFVRIKRAQEGIPSSIPQSEAQEGHSKF